METRIILVKTR